MAKHWVKEELHRDEVAYAIERLSVWIASHREAAAGIGASVLVAALLGSYTYSRYRDLRRQAWERLAVAQSYAFSGQDKTALEQLKAVEDQYPRTKAAEFGELFEGDVQYKNGDFKAAVESYQKQLQRNDPALAPFALSGIAFAQEAAGQPAAAAEAAEKFLAQFQDHFLAPQVHAVLARSLQALGRGDESKATMEKIVLLYPETYWALWAGEILHPQPKAPAAPPAKAAAAKAPTSAAPVPAFPKAPAAAPAPAPAPAQPPAKTP